MNCIPSDNLNLLVLCPVCGLRKALAAFIDPLTSSLVMCCNDCRSQRAQCYPVVPSKSSYPLSMHKITPKSKKEVKVIPQAKWSAVKRPSHSKERVFRARLVFHRTLH
ncbi:hypothetical protein WA577_004571 [Blastocystis sp. JDR]